MIQILNIYSHVELVQYLLNFLNFLELLYNFKMPDMTDGEENPSTISALPATTSERVKTLTALPGNLAGHLY